MSSNGPSERRYPRGWFVVGFSADLAVGQIVPKHYFGQDLVLYRTEDGRAHMASAFCPHLGAHFGYGGTVVGCDLQCPFHAWKFGPDGRCTEVPYAKRIPKAARIDTWTMAEHSGLLLLWHDPNGAAPDFEVPVLPEYGAADWSDWAHESIEIAAPAREVIENVADIAHFGVVHGMTVEDFKVTFDGPRATQWSSAASTDLKGRPAKFVTSAVYYGPACQYAHMSGVLKSVTVNAHVPITHDRFELHFGVLVEDHGDAMVTEQTRKVWIKSVRDGYMDDVAIWENKKWRDRPMLCDGDGPITKLRQWYQQFYGDESAPTDGSWSWKREDWNKPNPYRPPDAENIPKPWSEAG